MRYRLRLLLCFPLIEGIFVLIAHISDLHLFSLKGTHPLVFLGQRAVGGANLLLNRRGKFPVSVARTLIEDINAQKPDHLIISGDLSNLSLRSEFELCRELLTDIALPSSEITIVPGNHDFYTYSTLLNGVFRRLFEAYLVGDFASSRRSFPFVRIRGGVAIVALSSARPSWPLMATGTIGARQLKRMQSLLEHHAVRDRFRIVVVHHCPTSTYVRNTTKLTDADAFLDAIRTSGAELIVHGHLHRNLHHEVEGPSGRRVPMIGASSATWLSDEEHRRASYKLYRIEGLALANVRTRRFDLESQRYVEVV